MSYTFTFAPRTRMPPPTPIVRRIMPPSEPLVAQASIKPAVEMPIPDGMSKAVYQIIIETAERHDVTIGQMMGDNRHRQVAMARQETWWRIWREHGYSYPRIGRLFKKDHSTVIHGVRRHQERLAKEEG